MNASAARYFPSPYVGIAAILALLVVLTPVLITNEPPSAGTIFTQVELVVYTNGTVGANGTPVIQLYVHGVTDVVYARLRIGVAPFNWSERTPPWNASFRWTNASDTIAVQTYATANPFAVNVTAFYDRAGAGCYAGLAAFNYSAVAGVLYGRGWSGTSVPAATAQTALPISVTVPLLPGNGPGWCTA